MAWVRGIRTLAIVCAFAVPAACDDGATPVESDGAGSSGGSEGDATSSASATATSGSATTGPSTTADPTTDPSDPTTDPTDPSGSPTSDPTTDPTDPTGAESSSGEPVPGDGWIEIGYGLDSFFPFEGELPVTLGPQGFMMFSLPLRGSDFPVPPDPFDFDHPDTPILSVWTEIDGIPNDHPSGHFAAYLNYPVPFTLSEDEDVDYEFVSVWLVIPETYSPAELAGREAVLHAELACSDGQVLVDDHVLTVVDGTVGGGKG